MRLLWLHFPTHPARLRVLVFQCWRLTCSVASSRYQKRCRKDDQTWIKWHFCKDAQDFSKTSRARNVQEWIKDVLVTYEVLAPHDNYNSIYINPTPAACCQTVISSILLLLNYGVTTNFHTASINMWSTAWLGPWLLTLQISAEKHQYCIIGANLRKKPYAAAFPNISKKQVKTIDREVEVYIFLDHRPDFDSILPNVPMSWFMSSSSFFFGRFLRSTVWLLVNILSLVIRFSLHHFSGYSRESMILMAY